ncbi:DUF4382 domain-containing protein [Aliikangiella sp. G2MR2-5]|uniref:DUF4382 domain-containing protein n=1 Tax=Aliikangiella sp. G2MR2-5 TaxID=2788943 RepID=UPI0018AB63C0|nr:DUF4382 domain-containing protein [Aliikangiella sp. G2MR2-5]
MKLKITSAAIALALGVSLVACGGSDSDQTGTLALSVTDAPIDGATEVVVTFNGVEIKPQNGGSTIINFDEPKTIDLFALQNGETAPLLQNTTLDAGEYNWIRLVVDADQGEIDSYISFEDGSTHSLYIPSGSNTGLKLNSGFTIAAGATANFTIDFDLRKSVHKPAAEGQDYMLRPSLRILDNTEVGEISGFIAPSVVEDASCEDGLAVYAYSGADVTADDEGSATPPITSAMPEYDANNDRYNYTLSFLLAGDYTVAVTCDADLDDPQSDDDWTSIAASNVTVTVDQTTELNFE